MIHLHYSNKSAPPELVQAAHAAFKRLQASRNADFIRIATALEEWQEIRRRSVRYNGHDLLVVVGIGGSHWGARTLVDALASDEDRARVLFLPVLDERSVMSVIERTRQALNPHFIFVSKSGSTLETLALADTLLAQGVLVQARLSDMASVISEDTENPLRRWAKSHNLTCFDIPLSIGGRFSVYTPAGLVAAHYAGIDLLRVQQGAQWLLQKPELVAEMAALSLESFSRQEWVSIFWLYGDCLQSYGYWLQQLWSESLAKKRTRQKTIAPRVSFPVPCFGAMDQHSILQQLMEGARDKWVVFLRPKPVSSGVMAANPSQFSQAFWQGQSLENVLALQGEATLRALDQSGVSVLDIQLAAITPETLGAMLLWMECVVATMGEMLDINPFDQPGVELGKQLTRELLTNSVVIKPL